MRAAHGGTTALKTTAAVAAATGEPTTAEATAAVAAATGEPATAEAAAAVAAATAEATAAVAAATGEPATAEATAAVATATTAVAAATATTAVAAATTASLCKSIGRGEGDANCRHSGKKKSDSAHGTSPRIGIAPCKVQHHAREIISLAQRSLGSLLFPKIARSLRSAAPIQPQASVYARHTRLIEEDVSSGAEAGGAFFLRLAPGAAAKNETSHVASWHFSDVAGLTDDVGSWG
jgi:hypothetical protein